MAIKCVSGNVAILSAQSNFLNERGACECSAVCSTSTDQSWSTLRSRKTAKGQQKRVPSYVEGYWQQSCQGHSSGRGQRVVVAELPAFRAGLDASNALALPVRSEASGLASMGSQFTGSGDAAAKGGGKSPEVWLQDSVVEIVKNLEEAPFLHFIFDSKTGKDAKLQRKKVPEQLFEHPDSWAEVKDHVYGLSPDGFILVHRLEGEAITSCYGAEYSGFAHGSKDASMASGAFSGIGTDVWGLVVQGRHNKRHACYILRTTRVGSLDSACTRFSVTRAKCFGPTLHKQLENSWLL